MSALATVLHVVCGTVVLAVAPCAMFARKGSAWHARWGTTFVWAMAGVTASASVMWQAKGHLFLLWLDVISVYLFASGLRILKRRQRAQTDRRADLLDALAAVAAIVAGGVLVELGWSAADPLLRGLAVILIALGAIGATFGGLDLFVLRFGPKTRYGWLFYHLSAMIAAYISAVTAFVVINAHTVPMTLRWLVPCGIGSLVITAFSAKYRLRFWRAQRTAARAKARYGPNAAGEVSPAIGRSLSTS